MISLAIELGALTECPVFETHKRGKNWAATLHPDPLSPGGLQRIFWRKAFGKFFYMVPENLFKDDFVEFGADYYTGSGKKCIQRFYGKVISKTEKELILEKQTVETLFK